MKRASLFCLALVWGACARVQGPADTTTLSAAQTRYDELALFQMINQARVDNGIPPLLWNETLARYARSYALSMLHFNYLGHGDPWGRSLEQRVRGSTGIPFAIVGENIAMAPDVAGLNREIMQSPRHRFIVLRQKYSQAGVGIVAVPPGMTYTPFEQPVPEGYLIAVELFIR